MNWHFLLEWQFSALVLSIFLLIGNRYAIKSHHLKHRFLQLGFLLLVLLPLASFALRSTGQPVFSFFQIEAASVELIPVNTENVQNLNLDQPLTAVPPAFISKNIMLITIFS